MTLVLANGKLVPQKEIFKQLYLGFFLQFWLNLSNDRHPQKV